MVPINGLSTSKKLSMLYFPLNLSFTRIEIFGKSNVTAVNKVGFVKTILELTVVGIILAKAKKKQFKISYTVSGWLLII